MTAQRADLMGRIDTITKSKLTAPEKVAAYEQIRGEIEKDAGFKGSESYKVVDSILNAGMVEASDKLKTQFGDAGKVGVDLEAYETLVGKLAMDGGDPASQQKQ